jgi:fucose 4-O-acetylase-like acetyltransferase
MAISKPQQIYSGGLIMQPKMIAWVDNLKAVCIFLVVYGHFADLSPVLKSIIYSMHLPAFLMITGYLSLYSLQQPTAQRLIKGQLFYYLVLYGLFTLASSIIWYFLEARDQSISVIFKPLIASLWGLHGPSLELIHNNDPLWYFPFLITSLLLAFIFMHMPLMWKGVMVMAGIICYQINYLHPSAWSLDLAPMGALFILLGAGLRILENEKKYLFQKLDHVLCIVGLLIVWLLLVWANGYVNLNSREWGMSWVLFIFAAIAGTGCLIGICKKIPESWIARGLSRHTLIIFCTHIFLVKAVNNPIAQLQEGVQQWVILAAAIVITLVCWGISLVGQPLLTRWFKPKQSLELVFQKGVK